MIKMICGACCVEGRLKRASDGPFALPPAQEVRLVSAGVAVFVAGDSGTVATPVRGEDGVGVGAAWAGYPPASAEQETSVSDGEDENTAELQEGEIKAGDTLDIVDGHFTIESLMELSRADMEKLSADLGVDVRKCRNKSDIAALLAAVDIQEDSGGDAPPELGAEAPVV